MTAKKQANKSLQVPKVPEHTDAAVPADPEEPLNVPAESEEIIPDDDPFETPLYEEPAPGEGP